MRLKVLSDYGSKMPSGEWVRYPAGTEIETDDWTGAFLQRDAPHGFEVIDVAAADPDGEPTPPAPDERIAALVDAHSRDELLAIIVDREIEGVSSSATKDVMATAIVAADDVPPEPGTPTAVDEPEKPVEVTVGYRDGEPVTVPFVGEGDGSAVPVLDDLSDAQRDVLEAWELAVEGLSGATLEEGVVSLLSGVADGRIYAAADLHEGTLRRWVHEIDGEVQTEGLDHDALVATLVELNESDDEEGDTEGDPEDAADGVSESDSGDTADDNKGEQE